MWNYLNESWASNGDVFGCNLMSIIPELCAGNIREKGLQEIWNESPILNRLRNLKFEDLEGKREE